MTHTKEDQGRCVESEDSEHGYEFWLERLRGWQTEVRDTLLCITQVQEALLKHEQVVNEHFDALHALETSSACTPEARALQESQLRGYYHRARRRQESLRQSIDGILDEYSAIEPVQAVPVVFERTSPVKDKVGEASWESFPASDPPSSNPG